MACRPDREWHSTCLKAGSITARTVACVGCALGAGFSGLRAFKQRLEHMRRERGLGEACARPQPHERARRTGRRTDSDQLTFAWAAVSIPLSLMADRDLSGPTLAEAENMMMQIMENAR